MTRRIEINPVTRIEGHAMISLHLDDAGLVQQAHLHVNQLRGFEQFCVGRPFYEMPALMARICGICPVSHLVAASKACDELLAVQVPPTAAKLRRIMNLAQIIQSHALNFFHLSSPDLLLGMDSDPTQRNLFGLLQSHPERARDGIRLRQFGQQIIELLGGKRIHPGWVVPGGVNEPLSKAHREQMLGMVPDALAIIERTLTWFPPLLDQFSAEIQTFGNFPSLFVGLANHQGTLEHYDGGIRVMDSAGNNIAQWLEPNHYADYIGEAVEPDSYLKSPYYKPLGYPDGMYRVGPLARLNLVDRCGTPRADAAFATFTASHPRPVLSSFHYHYARLIEILYGIEQIELLLNDPDILSEHVRAFAEPNRSEGIGVSEAPRGTLIHHYRIDGQGLVTYANMIIASGNNNLAMNRGILQAARHFVHGTEIKEGMLNRVEAVIRAFDPCLSCSTHAAGAMPFHICLHAPDGSLLHELWRG
ncbi:MAG: Ni/Fe hydrogenase subunit alpha [Chloroflexaceae bacterium]|nr:Ni/Fe hydrogenase subunit alpha [Chloroflexaceae bacterium]